MSAEKVRTYLMEHGVAYRTHTHPPSYTTSGTATAEHVPTSQMAKPVMLIADGQLVMAVLPGDDMLDLDKARSVLRASDVRLATEAEFTPAFPDCEMGAEPPFGALYDVPMVVDHGLEEREITFNAGTHTEAITMALSDYLELTSPMRGDLRRGVSSAHGSGRAAFDAG